MAGDRPISVAASTRIIALVRDKHAKQMALARAVYVGMVGGLSPPIAARLMAIDLGQLNFPPIKGELNFPPIKAVAAAPSPTAMRSPAAAQPDGGNRMMAAAARPAQLGGRVSAIAPPFDRCTEPQPERPDPGTAAAGLERSRAAGAPIGLQTLEAGPA